VDVLRIDHGHQSPSGIVAYEVMRSHPQGRAGAQRTSG
jgi:hypothetical protein